MGRFFDKLRAYTYPFLDPSGRRKSHGSELQPLAVALDDGKRKRALKLARDLYKECPILRWACDFHCENVASFAFRPASPDKGLNRELQAFYDYFNQNADVAGRHTFEQLWDLWEHRRDLDGDVLIVRLDDGQLQTIQGDWLVGDGTKDCVQGVFLNEFGRALGYHVERQATDGTIFKSDIPAQFATLHAWYDHEVDSYRGVSPWIAALANAQDVDEVLTEMTTKIKLESRLAFAHKSRANTVGYRRPPEPANGNTEGHTDGDGHYTSYRAPENRLKLSEAVNILRLTDTEDIVNFLQTSPSSTFGQFFLMAVQCVLKVKGIPLTIYQENLSNYYCSRAAYGLYQNHLKDTIYYFQQLIRGLFQWRLAVAERDRELVLPAPYTPATVPFQFMYEQHSVLDEDREAKGAQMMIAAGLSTPQREASKRGYSFEDNILELEKAIAFAKEHNVPCEWGLRFPPPAPAMPEGDVMTPGNEFSGV